MVKERPISRERDISQIASFYKERFGYSHSHITEKINKRTKLIVVIPIFNEPDVITTLETLKACHLAKDPAEVILVINNSENGKAETVQQNELTRHEIHAWLGKNKTPMLTFHIMLENRLPAKHAGVGLARKIGMDEALYRFGGIEKNGIIACLDADCKVDSNYLETILGLYGQNKFTSGHLYFEHPLEEKDSNNKEGIINYELGLRYYVQALKFIQYPFAHHTIGSCMITSAKAYALSGGMNKRKAGEDFYFLHKLFPLGGHLDINASCVYPSTRISDRVPFGTGRAMGKWASLVNGRNQSNEFPEYKYYALQSFLDLSKFIAAVPHFWKCADQEIEKIVEDLPRSVIEYLDKSHFLKALKEIREQTKTEHAYHKRLYSWLDGFRVLKYIHFCREHFYADATLVKEASALLEHLEIPQKIPENPEKLLDYFRKLDRES